MLNFRTGGSGREFADLFDQLLVFTGKRVNLLGLLAQQGLQALDAVFDFVRTGGPGPVLLNHCESLSCIQHLRL